MQTAKGLISDAYVRDNDKLGIVITPQVHPPEVKDLARSLVQGFSSHHPRRMKEDDVAKLAAFTYHAHPDIFQEVLADQPAIVKFLSNPLVGAVMGAIASKWLGHRR